MKSISRRCTAAVVALVLALTTAVLFFGRETAVAVDGTETSETSETAETDTTEPADTTDTTDTADTTTSTTETTAAEDKSMDVHIGTVEIEMEQLIRDHYLVTVPITIPENVGFEIAQFGVSWDTTRMTGLGARCTAEGLTPMIVFSKNKDFIWMLFMGHGCMETNICSVTFQLDETVEAGEFLTVGGLYQDANKNPAQYNDAQMEHHPLNLIPGGISIVEDAASEVTLKVGETKASMQQLEENDYVVEVPVTASANTGFCDMVFGVTWDTSKLTAEAPTGDTPEGISLIPSFDNETGVGWVHVIADNTYTGSEICTLRFRVPEDTKPGQSYAVQGCMLDDAGNAASVSNRKGDPGTLVIEDGIIRVTSTQPPNAYAMGRIALPRIEVTPEELEANDYLVKVPICISQNSAFTQLAFGVSWNTNDLNIVDCICDEDKNLGMIEGYYEENNGVWLPFLYRGKNGAYVGTSLCTLTFRVRPDVMPGESIPLTADESNADGETAIITSANGDFGTVHLYSGSIEVVSAQDKSAIASVKLGDVEISVDDLWLYNYQVTVPIILMKNEGFASVAFGVSWDSEQALPVQAKSYDMDLLGLRENFYPEQDMAWLNYISVDPNENYVYSGDTLGSLILELPEDSQPGDVIAVNAVLESKTGSSASVVSADGSSSIPALQSGSIRITAGTQTTEATTTMPEETTTETVETIDTTAEITSESTETTTETTTTATTTTTTTTTTAEITTTTTTVTTAENGVYLEQTNLTVHVGQTLSLMFHPGEASGDDCVWLSDNTAVAAVRTGDSAVHALVSGAAEGTTEVMVLFDGKVYSCTVTVLPALSADSFGDINLDHTRDTADLVLLNKCIAGSLSTLSSEAVGNADLNGDGCVDCKDAFLLMQELLDAGLL